MIAYIKSKYISGIMQYKEESLFCTEIWLDTKLLKYLDIDCITKRNKRIYDNITNIIMLYVKKENLYICGIGIETSIKLHNEIYEIIYNSNNINRWIIPKQKKQNFLNYEVEIYKDFLLLSKYNF